MSTASTPGAPLSVVATAIPDVLLLQPRVFGDDRGFFLESYNRRAMADIGITADFVQDNHSSSAKNVLRGLHYQVRQPQSKLVRVVVGEIFDVAVDLRRSSPTFGKATWTRLSAHNKLMIWIPAGFAHGFLVVSDVAEVLYKASDFYAPQYERSLLWSDPVLGIPWPLEGEPLLSPKDAGGAPLKDAELFA